MYQAKSLWNIQNKLLGLFLMSILAVTALVTLFAQNYISGAVTVYIGMGSAVIMLFAYIAAARSITKPLTSLKMHLENLSKGIPPKIENFDPNSEMGQLFEAMTRVKGNLDAINTTQAVIQFTTDGTILNANKNFLATVGYELDEIVGQHHRMFGTPDFVNSQEYEDFWAKLGRGEFDAGEYYRVGKNGKPIWIFASYVPVFDHNNKPVRVVKFASDITKEVMARQAEAERKKEAELIALAASETDNLVVITDAQERIEYVNDGFIRLTGYSAKEVMGKKPSFLQGADTCKQKVKEIGEKVAKREPFYDEILNYKKDGTPYWVSLSINPVLDDDGNVVRFVSVQGDVTANKLAKLEDEQGQDEAIKVLNALAVGDLSQKMEKDYKGTFAQIKSAVNQTISKLSSITSDIRNTSQEVYTHSSDIADASDQLSHRTESQAATLEEINATMVEITTTVKTNRDLAEQSSKSASDAKDVAHDGQAVLQNLVVSMESISESSQKITDIIGLIDTIASQTNLLALNAAVEAARAGEAGQGFAVVASEVRTLASRSADASDEIKKLISESTKRVTSGSKLADDAGNALKRMIEAIDHLAGQVDEIAGASKDQAVSISEIGSALNSMDQVTQQNSQMAVKSTHVAQQLRKFSGEMTSLIEFFKGSRNSAEFSFSPQMPNSEAKTGSNSSDFGNFDSDGDDWFSGAA